MIVKAIFTNILSFDTPTEIRFTAEGAKSWPEQISKGRKRDDFPVLKTSLILGPNGAGKSNVCKCIEFIQNIAIGDFKENYLQPFKLGKDIKERSEISIIIKSEEKYFEYTVSFNVTQILSESLWAVNLRSRKLIFERNTTDGSSYDFSYGTIKGGENAKQFIEFIADGTPIDDSFLHEYIHRNGKGLDDMKIVYEWFLNKLTVIFPESKFKSLPYALSKDNEFSRRLCVLLRYFDTGVNNVKMENVDFENVRISSTEKKRLLEAFKRNPKAVIAMDSPSMKYFFEVKDNKVHSSKLVTEHFNVMHKPVYFGLDEESDGTLRLLDILPMMMDFQDNEAVYVIDEIDRSLHPKMTEALLEFYFKLFSPDKDTQLICTTHEAYLLDEKKLRPDQFWFIRKTKGASKFSSMGTRRLRKIVMKSYLDGDFKAIPYFDDSLFDKIFSSQDSVHEVYDDDYV